MSEMRGCPTCRFWKSTEMEAVPFSNAPHHLREAARRTELMRATEALCTWPTDSANGPHVMKWSPPWLSKQVGGGTLTNEEDGKDCLVWGEIE